ncbi:hypothetical protein MSAN_02303100 [Mycena sanguinolenta]|uniref:Uncharacterized protein n=1 Tax=Mycena sanguinolenta TaxID=230812 RepID=A0A8H6X9M7_9AGAR|nr:hypothetical protein MSAN_02303100 [Mycena sanguinolenta]
MRCWRTAYLKIAHAYSRHPVLQTPPHFVVLAYPTIIFSNPQTGERMLLEADELGSYPMQIADLLANSQLGDIPSSDLSTIYENLLQTVYHLVRVDLGVILPNQIYNSPEMLDRTIMGVEDSYSIANEIRDMTSDAISMARWQQEVEFFQNNTRVPPLEYLRSVPRLKPLGSAVTSVFVSTFAMLSVMWTAFSLVAGALARKNSVKIPKNTDGKKHTLEQPRTWDTCLESGTEELDGSEATLLGDQKEPDSVERLRHRIDKNEAYMRNDFEAVRAALGRLAVALKRRGVMEDENWVQDDDSTVE